jgi:hypothetical protein
LLTELRNAGAAEVMNTDLWLKETKRLNPPVHVANYIRDLFCFSLTGEDMKWRSEDFVSAKAQAAESKVSIAITGETDKVLVVNPNGTVSEALIIKHHKILNREELPCREFTKFTDQYFVTYGGKGDFVSLALCEFSLGV